MPRNLIAVVPIIALLFSCTPFRDRASRLDAGSTVAPKLLEVTRPRDGVVERLGSRRVIDRISRPLLGWYRSQFGLHGITPYVAPALLPDDKGERRDPETEMAAWLRDPLVRTLVVVGQDDYGGEGLVARFVHRLAAAILEGKPTPIPVLVEMCQILGPKERGRPLSRTELAARALEQRLGTRPDPRAIRADLESFSIILVVTDFDRLAEWTGPRGAMAVLQGLREGPGKVLLRARPGWFQATQRGELELLSMEAAREREKKDEVADTAWLVLTPLAKADVARAIQQLRPGDSSLARLLDRYPSLLAPARRAALTPIIFDILEDSLLREDVLAEPHIFQIHETWVRWAMEQRLGEGRVSLVDAAERALTHLAGRIYETGRLRLQPTGPREKVLLEAQFATPLCAPDAFLDCGEFGYAFRQGRWLDYFTARYLRERLLTGQGVDPTKLHRALASRRPGVGAMAFLAAALNTYPNTDRALREALALEAQEHCGEPGTRRLPAPAHATEAILRLRYLREGIVHPDGSLPENPADHVEPLLPDYLRVQSFWRQVLDEEERGLRSEVRRQVSTFLQTPAGRSYAQPTHDRTLVRAPDGTDWAFVPPGCGIVGAYFSPDEEPVRWVRFNRPFLLAAETVTNKEYKQFVDTGNYRPHAAWISTRWAHYLAGWIPGPDGSPRTYPEGHADYPVVNVSWRDAQAYATWRTGRDGTTTALPSANAWEYAARGTLGRLYPWGDVFESGRCNSAEGARWQVAPAGTFAGMGAGPFGNLDMAGNVWEWTGSRFTGWGASHRMEARTLVGGGWRSTSTEVRSSRRLRGVPVGRYDVVGFRLVRPINE